VPANEKDRTAFIMASRWADDIKRKKSYIDDGTHNGNRPPATPQASQNIGYSDHLRHKYWHFIDMPFSPDGTTTVAPPVPNAQTEIALFRSTLQSPDASREIKSYDLVWLIHLIADVHQPLHATSRFDVTFPEGDDGGNTVNVCLKTCSRTEALHFFWDSALGSSADPKAAVREASLIPNPDPQLAVIEDEATWIQESFQLAESQAYKNPVGTEAGPYLLTDDYKAAAKKVAQERIALAGFRLANLLNAALH